MKEKDQIQWEISIAEHDIWISRLNELGVENIIGTRPVIKDGINFNIAWIWTKTAGIKEIHTKYYLPNEEGFWESNWYNRGRKEFQVVTGNGFKFGIAICTEMWFMEHIQKYGENGVHMIIVPRSTPESTLDKWICGGMTVGVISGAYSISSNHTGVAPDGTELGGVGWISNPNGELLVKTSKNNPIITVEVDLPFADQAKMTYPRYVQR